MYFTISHLIKPEEVVRRLNQQLPEGLEILKCTEAPPKNNPFRQNGTAYRVQTKDFEFDKNAVVKFDNQKEVLVERVNKKGKTIKINLKNVVKNIIFTSNKEVEFILKPDNGKIVRPFEILKKIFNFPDEENKQARVVKIKNREV